ncbi:MAG TPA: HAMP domain-containing sensor histidine kinase [Planctomycetota bacterium]|nr:HAMP domain-containing sensor histidine kinase [Planctomycetota bacterium]
MAKRTAPQATQEELAVGIPQFLDDLIRTLDGGNDRSIEMNRDATLHGERSQKLGFSVAQLVHDYGDLCQVVTQLAMERRAPIDTEEFKTLNRCLDDAIAQAVTEHARVRERSISEGETERLGFLAHELRNLLQTASLSFEVLKLGTVGVGGSTGAVLARSLAGLRTLLDRTMAQIRLDANIRHCERVEIRSFLDETEAAGMIAAKDRGISLWVERAPDGVAVEADRQLLGSAVSNLLQNAFKFTREKGHVRVRALVSATRVVIEIEDQCGGLQPKQIEELFRGPHTNRRPNSGMGLGLSISKRAIEAMGGTLGARTQAEVGCVFTIDLPRLSDGAAFEHRPEPAVQAST